MNLRFSLLSIFVIVGIAAIFCLGLREPTSIWSDLCIMVTLFVLAAIAVRPFACRDHRKRMTAAGAAIFGVGYFIMIFSGVFFHPLWDNLPTSVALGHAYEIAYGPARPFGSSAAERLADPYDAASDRAEQLPVWPKSDSAQSLDLADPQLAAFSQVGHCAFSILFAVLGGLLGRYWIRTNPTGTPVPFPGERNPAESTKSNARRSAE